jgi:hypothetical protein
MSVIQGSAQRGIRAVNQTVVRVIKNGSSDLEVTDGPMVDPPAAYAGTLDRVEFCAYGLEGHQERTRESSCCNRNLYKYMIINNRKRILLSFRPGADRKEFSD